MSKENLELRGIGLVILIAAFGSFIGAYLLTN